MRWEGEMMEAGGDNEGGGWGDNGSKQVGEVMEAGVGEI